MTANAQQTGTDTPAAPPAANTGTAIGAPLGTLAQPHRDVGPSRSRQLMKIAIAVSIALHGGVFAATLEWAQSETGIVENASESVSVELWQSAVVESTELNPIPDVMATSASVDSQSGNSAAKNILAAVPAEEIEPAEELAQTLKTQTPDLEPSPAVSPTPGLEVIEGTTSTTDTLGPEAVKAPDEPAKQPAKTKRANPKAKSKIKPKSAAKKARAERKKKAARRRGGAKSRANSGSASSSARARASRGSIAGYASRVRARVSSRKPSGRGERGTVVISFGVSTSGGLRYARIARSSGSRGLDRRVLSAVRSASPFPRPPQGARASQLRYSMPFYFR
jgi:periplasmic protein TonB